MSRPPRGPRPPGGAPGPCEETGARLERFTTFRLGGPCRRLIQCPDPEALCRALREQAGEEAGPWVMGGGSNLLVSDEGLDRVVLRYAREALGSPSKGPGWIEVDGAAPLAELADWSVGEGWEGLVFAAGIPGTVGGGIAGNAGAFGRQLADGLEALQVADRRGRVRWADPKEFGFRYRHSLLGGAGPIVLRARFRVRRGDPDALRAERDRILGFRRARHPDWRVTPTAGSYFRNIEASPAAGRRQAAGWYLDRVGARSFRVGGAGVFEHHANIVVKRDGSCTACDVLELARRMAAAVEEAFGLRLVPEVRHVGGKRDRPATA